MKKKIVAGLLALSICSGLLTGYMPLSVKAETNIPDPYYEFTFDEEGDGVDGKVNNIGTKDSDNAEIGGDGEGIGIVEDEERNSRVLNLPGTRKEAGYLTLPDNMYEDVTENGFAFSFWIKIDENAAHYNRIFSSSSIPLNSNDGDNNKWNAPEFTFVVGGSDLSDSRYHSSIMPPNQDADAKLIWDTQFTKNAWQHVTISITPDSYFVYLDGARIETTDKNNNMAEILGKLFADNGEELKKFTHNAIGRSVYNTDDDIKAKIDEFRFYNVALTDVEALAAYDSYKVDDDIMVQLLDVIQTGKEKSISFYTRESYERLLEEIQSAEKVYQNPVTEENAKKAMNELESVIDALKYYSGIDENTLFSNEQLKEEIENAGNLENSEIISEQSRDSIIQSREHAETIVNQGDAASQAEVDQAVMDLRNKISTVTYKPFLEFDASTDTGEMLHGSTGFLYGVSEVDIPSSNLIETIQPKIIVQKAKDGKQHPSGDGYRLTNYLKESGVENIQIYLQDYYLEWPYEYNGIEDYNEKVQEIVSEMIAGKTEEEMAFYSFVIFNEPDGIWYNNSSKVSQMCEDWLKIYTTIKNIHPDLKVAGPNFAGYHEWAYEKFFRFASENDCLPEYITWHELQKDKLLSYKSHYDHMQGLIIQYYTNEGKEEPVIFINETVNFEDVGAPGPLVNWIAIFEETKTYAALPYWGLANSLNELAADTNKPNGAWWLYKWYNEMQGHTVELTKHNIGDPGNFGCLYGLTSVDESSKTIKTMFGGQAGLQSIQISNITQSDIFKDADQAYVKIYRSKYTGHHGFADDIPVVFEGNVPFINGDLQFSIRDAELMDGYFAVIMPAAASAEIKTASWSKTYEAENAALLGDAQAYQKLSGSDLARSGRAEVGNLNSENDGVEFTVDVPQDGNYRLNVYYSLQAPQVDPLTLEYVESNGQNRAIGLVARHSLCIDDGQPQDLLYQSTVKWGYYNYETVYVSLAQGSHKINIMHKGENQNGKDIASMLCALLDKIDLTEVPTDLSRKSIVEPEETVGNNPGFIFAQEESGYQGAGYVKGSGSFDYAVNVPEDGYYSMDIIGKGGNVSIFRKSFHYGADARAEAEVSSTYKKMTDITLGGSLKITNAGDIYLTAGINQLRCHSDLEMILDKIIFTYDESLTKDTEYIVEAENANLKTVEPNDDYNYLPGSSAVPMVVENIYASKGKAVEGFRGGLDNAISFQVDAPSDGLYKLSLFYANNEPAPIMQKQNGENYVHPYNTDLVERYAQIVINDQTTATVYFKNTLSWDVYKNVVVDVELNKGLNTITLKNDNSYKYSSVQDDFSPRFDKFVVAPAMYQEGVKQPEAELEKITVKTLPNKKVYFIHEAFDPTGLQVEAEYADGSTRVLSDTEYQIKGFDSQKAKKISVMVEYKNKTAEFEVEITIKELSVQKITTDRNTYVKTYGDSSFSLNSKTNGDGKLSYHVKNTTICTVDGNGKVTIKNAGETTITIKAAQTKTYKEVSADVKLTVKRKASSISGVKTSYTKTYGDKAFTLKPKSVSKGKISYKSGNTKICKVSSSGKVTIKNTGKVTITITSAQTNNYNKVTKKITLTIRPKKAQITKKKALGSRKVQVNWKKDTRANGYQLVLATDKKFSKNKKVVNITKNKTTSKTITKLKKGKTYYIKIRSYKKSGTVKIYGTYSKVTSVKIK